ncbi:MAG: L,D-transpeptidase family protein [Candidatus Omnitrophica bacterium]|nr:L,D-transpeptidase family protein [Candidatus Omnitrophota bacterium]
MIRKICITLLLVIVIGSLGGAYFLYNQRKIRSANMDGLHMAESQLEAEDFNSAITNLLPVVQYGRRFKQADYALYLLAQAYEGAEHKEASEIWKRLADDFPKSQYALEARLRQADSLLDANPAQARDIFASLQSSTDSAVRSKSILGVAQSYDRENDVEKARELYYGVIASVTDAAVSAKAKDRLSEINTERLWSPVLDEFCELYTVQRGDAAVKIGTSHGTTAWFIEEANNVKANRLSPGKRLKVPKEPFHIVVSKELCRLELRTASGRFIKWYPVGVGEQSYKTPAGNYYIINKQIDPTWFKPGGGVIPAKDPENALGSRWMGIGGSLGIHGTNAPETIGKPKSAGCIRMYNKDVEELFKIVTLNTNVSIVDGTEMNVEYVPKDVEAGASEG